MKIANTFKGVAMMAKAPSPKYRLVRGFRE